MRRSHTSLCLHEEIMLLALRDEKGTVEFGSMYKFAIGGAILAELMLADRVSADDGKRMLISVVNKNPVGDPILDECLQKIAAAKRRASAATWVQRIASVNRLRVRIAKGLCDRGILRATKDKFLLIFNRTVYPELDPEPERELIKRLRSAIFSETNSVDPRTVVLIALANSANLLRIPFEKKRLKERRRRIEKLTNGGVVGRATKQAVKAAQTAAVVACVLPATIATTSSG